MKRRALFPLAFVLSLGGCAVPATMDRMPVAVRQVPPAYPFEAQRVGAVDFVQIEFVVDRDGNVVNPRVVRSSDRRLEPAALAAIVKWKYRPGQHNGEPVNCKVIQQIDFSVDWQPPANLGGRPRFAP